MNVIDSLVPNLPTDRENALAPLRSRVRAAYAALTAASAQHGDLVERLARLDLATLRPRLKIAFYPVVSRARQAATDLLAAFDHSAIPVDLRDGFRAAVAATTDANFTSAMQALARDADRYVGLVTRVDALVRTLNLVTAELESGDSIWSDTFVVPAREQHFGGFNTQPATPATK